MGIRLPKSIADPKRTANTFKNAYLGELLDESGRALSRAGALVEIKTSGRMEATIGQLNKRGTIDLKPYFMRSPHAKRTKAGGWYMIVPINMSVKTIKRTSGAKTYEAIRSSFSSLGAGESATLNFDSLMSRSSSRQAGTIKELLYKPTGKSITATKSKTGNRLSYVAFRTVSNKSAPQSWVIGRTNTTYDNTSRALENNIGALIRNRIRQKEGLSG